MTFESSLPSRERLREVFLRWQRGDITFYKAVEEAEELEEQVSEYVIEQTLPVAEPWCVQLITLDLLASGFSEPLFAEDIPFVLEYLDTPEGQEIEATEKLWAQLEQTPSDIREAKANRLYSW